MEYMIAAIIVLVVLASIIIALVMVVGALALVLASVGLGWLTWHLLPFRHRLSKSPVDRLTDHYVAGNIDLGEFERRVARVLAGRS